MPEPTRGAGAATTGAAPWKPATFEEWVTYAPTAYLKCWDQGHKYDEWLGQNAEWQKDGSVMLYQICPSCGLPRDRWIGKGGEIDGRRNVYHYHRMHLFPYPYKPQTPRTTFGMLVREKRARIRLEILRREVEGRAVPAPPGQQQPVAAVRFRDIATGSTRP
jgi:hypothetical protein